MTDTTARERIENLWDRSFPVGPLLDAVITEATEPLRIRLWLIAQTIQPITTDDDPAGIVGAIGPWLDGPIHPDHIAAYRAAMEG